MSRNNNSHFSASLRSLHRWSSVQNLVRFLCFCHTVASFLRVLFGAFSFDSCVLRWRKAWVLALAVLFVALASERLEISAGFARRRPPRPDPSHSQISATLKNCQNLLFLVILETKTRSSAELSINGRYFSCLDKTHSLSLNLWSMLLNLFTYG